MSITSPSMNSKSLKHTFCNLITTQSVVGILQSFFQLKNVQCSINLLSAAPSFITPLPEMASHILKKGQIILWATPSPLSLERWTIIFSLKISDSLSYWRMPELPEISLFWELRSNSQHTTSSRYPRSSRLLGRASREKRSSRLDVCALLSFSLPYLRGSFLEWTISHVTNVCVNSRDGQG